MINNDPIALEVEILAKNNRRSNSKSEFTEN